MDDEMKKANAARRRYTLNTGISENDTKVIAFLCDEIERMREKVKECDKGRFTIEFLEKELRRCRDKIKEKDERINELILQCDALTPKEQEFTTEQDTDGGIMTIKNAACYQDIVSILLANGYFVCCHIDDENETIAIEFWRA